MAAQIVRTHQGSPWKQLRCLSSMSGRHCSRRAIVVSEWVTMMLLESVPGVSPAEE
jgi:hypothetical protein